MAATNRSEWIQLELEKQNRMVEQRGNYQVMQQEYHKPIVEGFEFSGKILDLACGTAPFLRHVEGEPDIIGIDISQMSLKEQASKYLTSVNGDAGLLPFKDGSFDIVFAGFAFHHLLPIIDDAIAEIDRILKPEGRVYVVDESLDSWFLARQHPPPAPRWDELPITMHELRGWFEKRGYQTDFRKRPYPFHVMPDIPLYPIRKLMTKVIATVFPYMIVGTATKQDV